MTSEVAEHLKDKEIRHLAVHLCPECIVHLKCDAFADYSAEHLFNLCLIGCHFIEFSEATERIHCGANDVRQNINVESFNSCEKVVAVAVEKLIHLLLGRNVKLYL